MILTDISILYVSLIFIASVYTVQYVCISCGLSLSGVNISKAQNEKFPWPGLIAPHINKMLKSLMASLSPWCLSISLGVFLSPWVSLCLPGCLSVSLGASLSPCGSGWVTWLICHFCGLKPWMFPGSDDSAVQHNLEYIYIFLEYIYLAFSTYTHTPAHTSQGKCIIPSGFFTCPSIAYCIQVYKVQPLAFYFIQ